MLHYSVMMNKEYEGVVVQAQPQVCLHDVPTKIMVSGCPPSTPVTITMDTYNDQGKKVTLNSVTCLFYSIQETTFFFSTCCITFFIHTHELILAELLKTVRLQNVI